MTEHLMAVLERLEGSVRETGLPISSIYLQISIGWVARKSTRTPVCYLVSGDCLTLIRDSVRKIRYPVARERRIEQRDDVGHTKPTSESAKNDENEGGQVDHTIPEEENSMCRRRGDSWIPKDRTARNSSSNPGLQANKQTSQEMPSMPTNL
ncbi:hypothetical protein DMN91_005593 [Ooceraea biroi]|uniref:Uncharacterized protein n=1 Tax=Ooceraea biroi TaxID=2015173 RepID=A0A3L8DLA7_OOCBI|nr:hypothetical protein DMN91_005593 [Ooceraea biroi]